MKPHHLAMIAIAVVASAGLAQAEETTSVYRQGQSSATITQDDGGSSTTTRRVIRRGPNSQTIIQQQGGNSASITQGPMRGTTRYSQRLDTDLSEDLKGDTLSERAGDVSRVQITVSMTPEEQEELQELALDEDSSVQALVEEAIQDFLDRN